MRAVVASRAQSLLGQVSKIVRSSSADGPGREDLSCEVFGGGIRVKIESN